MEIFREFVDDNEREAYIESERLKNEREHCYALLEMVQIKHEQRLRDIELQVLEEGGTYDDYAFLVKEAEEQKAQTEDGIFQKLWNIILSILRSIKEFLFGKGKEIKPETEVEVPENFAQVGETLTKLSSSNNIFSFIKWFILTGGAGAGILFVQDKYVKMKYSDVQSWAQKIRGALSNMQKTIMDFIKDTKMGQAVNSFLQQHKQQIETITGPVKDATSFVGELFSKAFGEVNKVFETIKGKVTNLTNKNNQTPQGQPQPQQGQPQAQQGQTDSTKRTPTKQYGTITNQAAADKAQSNKRDISYGGFVYRVINNVINIKNAKQPDSSFRPLDQRAIANLPKNVRRPLGFESADDEIIDLSDIRLALGPTYEVTLVSEDAIDITYLGDNIENDIIYESLKEYIDNYISVEESIFGSKLSDETFFKESKEEKERAELEEFSALLDLL